MTSSDGAANGEPGVPCRADIDQVLRPAVVRRLAAWLPRDRAEDAAGQVLEVFWRRYGSRYRDLSANDIAKLLSSIITKTRLAAYRRLRAERAREVRSPDFPWGTLAGPAVPGSAPHLTFLDVVRELDELCELDHRIVLMSAYGAGYDEIAEAMGLTRADVRNRLYALRQRLRRSLAD